MKVVLCVGMRQVSRLRRSILPYRLPRPAGLG